MLKEEERKFLQDILKFGNYTSGTGNGIIKYIVKQSCWLKLHFSPYHCNSVYIDKEIYFKGLNEDEEYTLKELNLLEKGAEE